MNKRTVTLTDEQYADIVHAIRTGFCGCRPNNRVATAMVVEANTGLRVGDVIQLRLDDIIKDGNRYRYDITEQKTGKIRRFTIPSKVVDYIREYAEQNNISPADKLFAISERQMQSVIKRAADYCGYEQISTHSFRKYFATKIYVENGYNVALVQHLLQHSDPSITQKYIGIEPQEVENALKNHVKLL